MNRSIEELRRKNLALLKEQWGGEWQSLAKKIGKSPSHLSQIQSGHRPFTEKTARAIEQKLVLAERWLDLEHDSAPQRVSQNEDAGVLARVIAAIDSALKAENADVGRGKYGRLVTFIYEDSRERGAQNESWIRRLVKLIVDKE